jgi:hypothetical protein
MELRMELLCIQQQLYSQHWCQLCKVLVKWSPAQGMAKDCITYSITKFNAMKNSLTFTRQTECPCPTKYNTSQTKGKNIPCRYRHGHLKIHVKITLDVSGCIGM